MSVKSPFVAFDLEGPLTPNDSILELMELFPGGNHVLQILNRYSNLPTGEGQGRIEATSLAALVVPFLVIHGITLEHMHPVADKATAVAGAKELIAALKSSDWQVHCITAAYLPYARRLAERLGLDPQNVWGTVLPLDYYRKKITRKTQDIIKRTEQELASLEPGRDDRQIKERLDGLFSTSRWGLTWLLQEISPMVGRRKLLILHTFALAQRFSLKEVVVVGDSIADVPMLEAVNKADGLAVGFNATQTALAHATIGLASTSILDLLPVLEAWREGGRESAISIVKSKTEKYGKSDRDNFHVVEAHVTPAEIHTRLRRLVRPGATELS